LFRVLDPGAILAIVLLCLELLQETKTGRSGRVPRSAVLGRAETLLAAVRHLITNESCAPNFSQPASHHGASFMRFAETMITWERIALIVKRREVETFSLLEQNAAVRRACYPRAVVSSITELFQKFNVTFVFSTWLHISVELLPAGI
jgi:hypothetical protein